MTGDGAAVPTNGAAEETRLRDALAVAQGDLRLHAAALARLQGELIASRLEVAGARGETVHIRGYLAQSQAEVASAHAHIGELRADAAGREARFADALAGLRTEAAALRAELDAVHASFSWRVSRPVRVASRVLRRVRRLLGPGTPVAAAAPPAPVPADPNAPYLFTPPASPPGAGTGPVTVEDLHALSRSP